MKYYNEEIKLIINGEHVEGKKASRMQKDKLIATNLSGDLNGLWRPCLGHLDKLSTKGCIKCQSPHEIIGGHYNCK